MTRFLFICVIGFLLSACASLLPAPDEPTRKYTLVTLEDPSGRDWVASLGIRPHQVVVDLPTLYPPLDNTRIALKPQEQTIDYYADVEWADRLGVLIQESLIYSLENKGMLRGVSRPTEAVQADYLLKVEVRKFYVNHTKGGAVATARVDYLVHLIKLPERHIVASRSFTQSREIADPSMEGIVKSLNMAHVEALKELVPWVGEHVC